MTNRLATKDAKYWDEWWKPKLPAHDRPLFSCLPGPRYKLGDAFVDLANADNLLIQIMAEYGLRSVLCAGSGISSEPRSLAAAGFDVTALDISSVATAWLEACPVDPTKNSFCDPKLYRPGGCIEFVVGDLLDNTVCPGPFDVVIERRTVQTFPQAERSAALTALAARLNPVGIFLSLCLDDPFPMDIGWAQHKSGLFHASQSWFQEHNWAIWDCLPSSKLTGQVGWLIRSGSLKLPHTRRLGRKSKQKRPV